MTTTKNVLISGASIAGPAAAFWLRRFGYNPTVVERFPGIREGGQAVDFRGPVHRTVLERMGLLDAIRERALTSKPFAFVDDTGKTKASMPADFAGGEIEIRRGPLSKILYDATCDTTEYIFGDWITSVEEQPDGVRVTFHNGSPRTFDLVIGADGMNSGLRPMVFGDDKQNLHFKGWYFAVFPHIEKWEREEHIWVYNEPGRAASPGQLMFHSDELDYDRHDIEAQKQIVADRFAGMGYRTPEVLEAMWAATEFYMDSISLVRMERFTKGRFALVGDAGYGATFGGFGTGLAVVGAYVLAGELAAAGGDHNAAFPLYEAQLGPYSKGGQGGGAGKFLAPASKAGIWQRNVTVKMMFRGPFAKMIERIDKRIASNFTLKDYAVSDR